MLGYYLNCGPKVRSIFDNSKHLAKNFWPNLQKFLATQNPVDFRNSKLADLKNSKLAKYQNFAKMRQVTKNPILKNSKLEQTVLIYKNSKLRGPPPEPSRADGLPYFEFFFKIFFSGFLYYLCGQR